MWMHNILVKIILIYIKNSFNSFYIFLLLLLVIYVLHYNNL